MSEILDSYKSFLLVGIGAAPGAILRMHLVAKLSQYNKSNFYAIQIVNTIATFLLGLTLAYQNRAIIQADYQQLYLFISVGFLGSLSTFSSLIYEFYLSFLKKRWFEIIRSSLLAIIAGMFSLSIGYYLGNV